MNEELKNLIKVWSSAVISICYCYFVSTKIKVGVFRLLSVLPVCVLFLVLPLFLSSVHLSAFTAFFLSWLANFRLIIFSSFEFDENLIFPLSPNLFQFICFTCFPINPHINHGPKNILSKKFAIEVAILGAVLHMYDHQQDLNRIVLLCLYPLHLYLVLEILLKLFNAFLFMTLEFDDIVPELNEPYLATSLKEFWARWWDFMFPERQLLFMYPMCLVPPVPGMNLDLVLDMYYIFSFLVSGVFHELLFFYITREPPTGEVTMFFVLHGVCMAAEMRLKMKIARLEMKTWVSQVIVVGFMVVTADWLFFPPLVRSGKIQKLANESQFFYFWVIKLLKS